MPDFPSLKLLDRFAKVFTSFGVDYPIMRKILQVKLIMDRRRVPTVFSQNNRKSEKQQKDKNHYLLSLWIYVLFGLFLIPFYDYGRQLPLPNESRVWDAHLFRHDLDDFRLFIGPPRYP